LSGEYILTDANGEPIRGERYDRPGDAIEARAILMAEHEDGDKVTIEQPEDCSLSPETDQ